MFVKIRTVLLLSYLVIILICIALVGAVSFYISYKSLSERVESTSFQIVRQIERNMDNDFHNKRYLLLAPYYNQQYIDGINAYTSMNDEAKFLFRRSLGDLYLRIYNTTPIRDFIRFQIYYSDGVMLNASDNKQPWSAEEVQHSDWFQQTVVKTGKVHFTGPLSEGDDNGDAAYSSSILIRDFSNPDEFIVVRVEYRSALFDNISQNNELSENSQLLVLNEQNELVYTSSGWSEDIAPAALLTQITGNNGGFWFGDDPDEKMISYTRSEYSNWKVVIVLPKAEIFSSLDRIKTATMITALLAFLVTFLISVLFGRRITKPILHLYKTVNRIKRGDFSVRVDVDRKDEIGRIAMNFNDMQDELQKLIETKYIYQIKLQEAELAMLYSQINPHFLYNTLDSIKAMADYYKVEQIGDMSQSLANIFRYNTKNNDELVTLEDELNQIKDYMHIQTIRFEDKLAYKLEIEEELKDLPLLKMTLQPILENAVFHGIEPKRGKGTIRITAQRLEHQVQLTITDDGVGIPSARLHDIQEALDKPLHRDQLSGSVLEGSIGIRNVYARYAIRLGEQFQFKITSVEGKGTEVTLSFQVKDSGQNIKHYKSLS